MKIRTRLTILFSLITAAILLAFAMVIYFSAKENREREFYALLKKEAITKANLFLNAEVAAPLLQNIYRNNREILNEVEVAIFDTAFQLLYHDAVDIDVVKETEAMTRDILNSGEIRFYQSNWQVVGLTYRFQNQTYVITAAAYDAYGFNKLNSMLQNSILVFICAILIIYLAGRFFTRKALAPVREMTDKAQRITATKLDLRLPVEGNKDELSELANTFNQMLNRLERSFDAQKHFVSNISHELRTPLAAMIAELELGAAGERSLQDCQLALQNALSDAKKLVRLSNSLLDFAKASYDPSEIAFKPTRIDEVLLDARQQLQRANADYKIDLHFELDAEGQADDKQLRVQGNAYLLQVAFANLMENACKFSDNHSCSVSILVDKPGTIRLDFKDQGMGIARDDLAQLFTPFFRGANRQQAEGNGIGLSLTQKIVWLHQGSIAVESVQGQGSCFSLHLPHA